jgi:hypothetical protein
MAETQPTCSHIAPGAKFRDWSRATLTGFTGFYLAISLKPCFLDEIYRDLSTSRPETGAPSVRVNAAPRAAGLLFLDTHDSRDSSAQRRVRRDAPLYRVTLFPLRVDDCTDITL